MRGFETDWRDVYPGVNAVTLLEVQGDEKALRLKERLLPVVRFAAEQRLRGARHGYWDHATMLELAVLADDAEQAEEVLADVLSTYAETWPAADHGGEPADDRAGPRGPRPPARVGSTDRGGPRSGGRGRRVLLVTVALRPAGVTPGTACFSLGSGPIYLSERSDRTTWPDCAEGRRAPTPA